jgi:hypothetical protein
MQKYFDKHGKEIKQGMTIKHDDGDIELVYQCEDSDGNQDLGVNASNEAWLERHGGVREIYPLYQFNMKEWEIVKENEDVEVNK